MTNPGYDGIISMYKKYPIISIRCVSAFKFEWQKCSTSELKRKTVGQESRRGSASAPTHSGMERRRGIFKHLLTHTILNNR